MIKKAYSRIKRIDDLIQNALAEIIQRETENLHIGIVTITSVSVSQDFAVAKVYVSVLEEARAKEILEKLKSVSKSLRYELAHKVKIRVTPELRFYYDDSTVRGSRISSLINDVLKDNK